MFIRRGDNIYELRWVYGHWLVYKNKSFICSSATEEEAYKEIDETENDI